MPLIVSRQIRRKEFGSNLTSSPAFHHVSLIRILLCALLASALVTPAIPAEPEKQPPQNPPPHTLKQFSGKTHFGASTAWDGPNSIVQGPQAALNRQLILENFNCIQPAVYPARGGFWPPEKPPTANDYSFWTEPLTTQADWAKQHDLFVLHHGLLAPNYYFPDWWKSTRYPADELEVILKKYVTSVVSIKSVDAWNLFNELFHGNGTYFPDGDGDWDNKWLGLGMEPDRSGLSGEQQVNKTHPRFIRLALETAALHTTGKLELREGTTFETPRKLDALYQLVLHLKNSQTPLHAVGIQGHLDYNGAYDFAAFKSQVKRFREAGVEFYITELDVGLPKGENSQTADWETIEARQAEIYYQFIKAAREAEVSLISVWGITDTPAGGWRGGEKALLFDQNHRRKPTYEAVLKAFVETESPPKN